MRYIPIKVMRKVLEVCDGKEGDKVPSTAVIELDINRENMIVVNWMNRKKKQQELYFDAKSGKCIGGIGGGSD